MTLQWLLSDWNLAFALPLALALVYLGLYVVSGITFGEPDAAGDADADADAGADGHADGHVDLHDVQAHDVHAHDAHAHDFHGHGHDHAAHDHGGHPPAHFTVLNWFGVGRVPLSLLLAAALLGWGAFGLGTAAVLRQRGLLPTAGHLPSLAGAITGALVAARGVTFLLTRVVPINETYARRRHELLGSEGEAIYAIDDRFGMVAVRDDRGELFQVGCRLDASVIGAVGKGARVKLVGYNKDANLFTVVPVAEVATAAGSVLRKRVG